MSKTTKEYTLGWSGNHVVTFVTETMDKDQTQINSRRWQTRVHNIVLYGDNPLKTVDGISVNQMFCIVPHIQLMSIPAMHKGAQDCDIYSQLNNFVAECGSKIFNESYPGI